MNRDSLITGRAVYRFHVFLVPPLYRWGSGPPPLVGRLDLRVRFLSFPISIYLIIACRLFISKEYFSYFPFILCRNSQLAGLRAECTGKRVIFPLFALCTRV